MAEWGQLTNIMEVSFTTGYITISIIQAFFNSLHVFTILQEV
jgi:hypothetical protein